ncbi:hypothetical protein [Streptomyces sp. SAJ15]|nr:hypothetical protein [Streptomyces sp. SAJ15]
MTAADPAHDDGTTTAYQDGPRRLADEIEQAWDAWAAAGEPASPTRA